MVRYAFVVMLLALSLAVKSPSQEKPKEPEKDPNPVRISDYHEIIAHLLTSVEPIRQEKVEFGSGVKVELTIDPAGNVVDAVTENKRPESVQAVQQARSWKFKPFEKNGKPVTALIIEYVPILPPETLPKVHVKFPEVKQNSLRMSLHRTACYGSCPAYTVEISGDGVVTFTGTSYVLVTGQHHTHISQDSVAEILHAFQKADYFSLNDDYRYPVTDCPTYVTSITIGNQSKTVTDYMGENAGMPHFVAELEETIDRVTGTARWIRGNEDTVSGLISEGWDFKTKSSAEMLVRAARMSAPVVVRDLLKAGTAPDGTDEMTGTALEYAAGKRNKELVQLLLAAAPFAPSQKNHALYGAARAGDLGIVRILLEHGADPNSVEKNQSVLMDAVASNVPDVVVEILTSHPDVNLRDSQKRTPIFYVNEGHYGPPDGITRTPAEVVRMLVKAGAQVNAQDEDGNTALHGVNDPEIAKALIAGGADVNARNKKDQTPLMKTWSANIARVLIEAGADIMAKDSQGQTALDRARRQSQDVAKILEAAQMGAAKK